MKGSDPFIFVKGSDPFNKRSPLMFRKISAVALLAGLAPLAQAADTARFTPPVRGISPSASSGGRMRSRAWGSALTSAKSRGGRSRFR